MLRSEESKWDLKNLSWITSFLRFVVSWNLNRDHEFHVLKTSYFLINWDFFDREWEAFEFFFSDIDLNKASSLPRPLGAILDFNFSKHYFAWFSN